MLINPPCSVNEKIKELSQARLPLLHLPAECSKADKLAELERQLRQVALKISKGLVARMDSPLFLRFFGASVNMVLVRLYNQEIHISLSEYAAFREVAELAAEKKQSLLIVPNHRSHIDYLSISWLVIRGMVPRCFTDTLPSPGCSIDWGFLSLSSSPGRISTCPFWVPPCKRVARSSSAENSRTMSSTLL